MTSLVFSYHGRAHAGFLASHQTQLVLGTFVLVILYCLLVLPTVDWRASEGVL